MIIYTKTDIFKSDAEVLVNFVNTAGAMGDPLSSRFKSRYPDIYKIYRKNCFDKTLKSGMLMLNKAGNKRVLTMPIKSHWRKPEDESYIREGLVKLKSCYKNKKIKSIAIPKIPNSDWKKISPIFEEYLGDCDIKVYINK